MIDANCPGLSEEQVRKIIKKVAELAEMMTISKTYTVKGADYNPGVSGFVFIEFSNICIHTFEGKGKTALNFDLFSCRKFNTKRIIKYLKEQGLANIESQVITRKIKL